MGAAIGLKYSSVEYSPDGWTVSEYIKTYFVCKTGMLDRELYRRVVTIHKIEKVVQTVKSVGPYS